LAQYDGACRYISHDSGKCITASQVADIHGAGKSVVLNFEDSATNAQGGATAGRADAGFAVSVARSLHAPAGVAIYASVDYEVHSGAPLTVAEDYFAGWTPVVRAAGFLSGAYGDADLITALLQGGLIDLGWQTVAWSYGARVRDSRAALLQDQFTPGYDVDEITAAFYGGWMPSGAQTKPGGTSSPTPTPILLEDEVAYIVQVNPTELAKAKVTGPLIVITDGLRIMHVVHTEDVEAFEAVGVKYNPAKPISLDQYYALGGPRPAAKA
jgi:hypothetical protein